MKRRLKQLEQNIKSETPHKTKMFLIDVAPTPQQQQQEEINKSEKDGYFVIQVTFID